MVEVKTRLRWFDIGEKVICKNDVTGYQKHPFNSAWSCMGKVGIIHSKNVPMNTYRVDFPDGTNVDISPFGIEPI